MATTYTWAQLGTGAFAWTTVANWGGVAYPGQSGTTDIASLFVNITGAQTINVDADITLSRLEYGDSSGTTGQTIQTLTSKTITLDSGSSAAPVLFVSPGAQTSVLSCPIKSTTGLKIWSYDLVGNDPRAAKFSITGTNDITGDIEIRVGATTATNGCTIGANSLGAFTNTVTADNAFFVWNARTWEHPVNVLPVWPGGSSSGAWSNQLIFKKAVALKTGSFLMSSSGAASSTGNIVFDTTSSITAESSSCYISTSSTPSTGARDVSILGDTSAYTGLFRVYSGAGTLILGGSRNHTFGELAITPSTVGTAATLNINSAGGARPIMLLTGNFSIDCATSCTAKLTGLSVDVTTFHYGRPGASTNTCIHTLDGGQTLRVLTSVATGTTGATISLARNSGTSGQAVVEWNCTTSNTTAVLFVVGANTALNVSSNNAMPANTSSLTVQSTGQFGFLGNCAPNGTRTLTVTGTGFSSTGAVRNISGTNTCANQIALSGATTIGADAGTLEFTNATGVTGAQALTLAPASGATLKFSTSKIATAQAVTQSTAGTVILQTQGTNTSYAVNAGTLSPQGTGGTNVCGTGTVTVANTGKIKTLNSVSAGKATFAALTFNAPAGANYATVHIGASAL